MNACVCPDPGAGAVGPMCNTSPAVDVGHVGACRWPQAMFAVPIFVIPSSMLTWGFEAEAERLFRKKRQKRKQAKLAKLASACTSSCQLAPSWDWQLGARAEHVHSCPPQGVAPPQPRLCLKNKNRSSNHQKRTAH